MDEKEQEELRSLVRRELENRERLRSGGSLAGDGENISAERRRIIDDEIKKFYLSKGGFKPYENEDGDVEWLTEAEALERDRQIPIDMEELDEGQRKVRLKIVLMVGLAFLVFVLLLFAMRDRYGTIQVISNVPGATIILDGAATEFTTDSKLSRIRPGVHLVSIQKVGYSPDGPASLRVNVRAGKHEVAALRLKPQIASEPRGGQSQD